MKPHIFKMGKRWYCRWADGLWTFGGWRDAVNFGLVLATTGIPSKFPEHVYRSVQ